MEVIHMSGEIGILISFLFFLGLFAGVGLASMRVKKDTTDDYLVAGRGMHPALAALSAVSTWNSGYMFIGAVGFTYMMGYNVIWMAVASMAGQLVAWAWLYKFIQQEGRERNVRSLSSLVAEKAGAPEAKLAAILSVLFLSIYAAAQLTSGGKALLVMLGWDELIGILIGFVLVVAYCYAGGIRASIWTDAVQSCVMIVGSLILCWIALGEVGGFSGLNSELNSQDPALTNIMPPGLMFGVSMWAFAFFLGGLAVAGQPQVVSRIMTLDSDSDRKQAMVWFFVWQTPFIIMITFIGLASRVLFDSADFDPELGLPMLAMSTMPALGVGMILASIFAATMSTADSQVLACTAAITDDVKPEWREDHKTTKKVTLVVAAFATAISIGGLYVPGGDSVFKLVVLAVYGLGSVFVPLLIIRWAGFKPDSTHSIVMMVSAFSGVIVWSMLPAIMGWKTVAGADGIFPSVPGMGAAFLAHFLMCAFREASDSNPLGRFKIPEAKKSQMIGYGIALLFVAGVAEASYAIYAPEEIPSNDKGEIGVYAINGNVTYHDIGSGQEYINDGQMVTIEASSENGNLDGLNIVGFRVTTSHVDDEPNGNPLACAGVANEDDLVSVSGGRIGMNVSSSSGTESPLETYGIFIPDVLNQTLTLSIDDIEQLLDAGTTGFGDYAFDIEVSTNAGSRLGCNKQDEGEQVDWIVELISLEYSITEVTE
jgi:Na+/proline symporter|tara:strand:- start:885 stop:3014 length:2130 start_codon:yes stop_codon:yes gene_type:complete